MTVRIGKVELRATRRLEANEPRSLVATRVPGHAGSVTQDLGRDPVLLFVEGTLYGSGAVNDLEALRAAHTTGEPQAFASDIAVGTELTEVVVEDLRVTQRSGTVDTWLCTLRLREHTEPPEPANAGILAVNGGVMSKAGDWMKVAGSVMRVLNDPSCLAEELLNNPELLSMLGADDLARAIQDNLSELGGPGLRSVIEVLQEVDPKKAMEVVRCIVNGEDPSAAILALGMEFGSVLFEGITGDALPPEVGALVSLAGRAGDLKRTFEQLAANAQALAQRYAALRTGGAM